MQFGVFGPILAVVLLRTAWREIRRPSDPSKVLLLSFSLPVLALLAVQALLSRAHGNWTATAYPAASILVTAVMLELNRQILFRMSLGLHLAIAVMLAAAPAFALQLADVRAAPVPVPRCRLARRRRCRATENWPSSTMARSSSTRARWPPSCSIICATCHPLYVWPSGPTPKDQYEMTRPFTAATPEPILFRLAEALPGELRDVVRHVQRILGSQRVTLVDDEVAHAAFLPPCQITSESLDAGAGSSGALSL